MTRRKLYSLCLDTIVSPHIKHNATSGCLGASFRVESVGHSVQGLGLDCRVRDAKSQHPKYIPPEPLK